MVFSYLVDLVQIVRNVRYKKDDNVGVARHESSLLSLFQILIDALYEWLDLRPSGGGFGTSGFLNLAELLCLLLFRVCQG